MQKKLISHLKLKVLFKTIAPPTHIEAFKDPFHALCAQIIYQQISSKAGFAIENRFFQHFNYDVTPEALMQLTTESAKTLGLSASKYCYLQNAAQFVLANSQLWQKICNNQLSNTEVYQ